MVVVPQKWACKVYAQEEAARELSSFHFSIIIEQAKRM
jgi:hypothetical protein